MKPHLLALSVGIVALILSVSAARAQGNCAARAIVLERLASKYGESRQSVGIAANNAIVEVYANPESGSWSIIVTAQAGKSCLVASGRGYAALANVAPVAMGVPV